MTRGWPVIPGVAAAGHVAANGAWHPGADQSCLRAPCSRDYHADVRKFPEGGHGELYCPWCSATLVAFGGLDPVKAAEGHAREQRHTGRPIQINRAIRLALLSRTDTKETRDG